jgi:hypothetical protein
MNPTGAPAHQVQPSAPAASADLAPAPAAGVSTDGAFSDFAGFLRQLREPGLPPAVISPRRFSEALNVDLQTLAAWAHVHRNTVQRSPGSEAVQAYLRHALRVIRAATSPCGGMAATLFWFRNEPLPTFDFETPARVVSAQGSEPLLRALRTQPTP